MGHSKSQCRLPINKEKQRVLTLQREKRRTEQDFRMAALQKATTTPGAQQSSLNTWQTERWPIDQAEEVEPKGEDGCRDNSEPITTNSLQLFGESKEKRTTTAQRLGLEKYPSPTVMVTIGGKEVQAIIDTGSVVSVIRTDLAARLPGRIERWYGNELKATEGNSVKPRGVKTVKIIYFDETYEIPMMVTDHVRPSVILGQNFNLKVGIVVNCKEKKIILPPDYTKRGYKEKTTTQQSMPNKPKKVQTPLKSLFGYSSSDESQGDIPSDTSMFKCTIEGVRTNVWDIESIQPKGKQQVSRNRNDDHLENRQGTQSENKCSPKVKIKQSNLKRNYWVDQTHSCAVNKTESHVYWSTC